MRGAFCFLALALAIPSAGLACVPIPVTEPEPGFVRRPLTNIGLLDEADLVVLAEVREAPVEGWEPGCLMGVTLAPQRALKGTAPDLLPVEGLIRERVCGEYFLPSPTALDEIHPSSRKGSCRRSTYSKQALVIAMFEEKDGAFSELDHRFSRAIEDVEGPDALWVRAAELYLRILSENAPVERREAFASERDRLAAMTGDPDSQAIAADITTYLEAAGQD